MTCFNIFPVVVSIFITERIEFTKALLKSDMNKPGKEMAEILNSLQPKDNEAAIVSPRFASFYQMFTDFYSYHPYAILNEKELKDDSPDR